MINILLIYRGPQAMGALVLDSPVDNACLPEMSKYAQVSNLVQVRVREGVCVFYIVSMAYALLRHTTVSNLTLFRK